MNLENRHRGVRDVARWFAFDHLPEGRPRRVSETFHTQAMLIIEMCPDGPELVKALNDLLAAKDWAVRSALSETLPA
jgi:hypothetical protein